MLDVRYKRKDNISDTNYMTKGRATYIGNAKIYLFIDNCAGFI